MRALAAIFCAMVIGVSYGARAQYNKDPPWNSEHITGLPIDVRAAVLAMCSQQPSAGHYFATYNADQVNLHFEHFHCGEQHFCNASKCLHQVYRLTNGHYHLAKSFYGPGDD